MPLPLIIPLLLAAASTALKMRGNALVRKEQNAAYEANRKKQSQLAKQGQAEWQATADKYNAPQMTADQQAGAGQISAAMQQYTGQSISTADVAPTGSAAYQLREGKAVDAGGQRAANLQGYDWSALQNALRGQGLQRGLYDINDQAGGTNRIMAARLAGAPDKGAAWNAAGTGVGALGSALSAYSMLSQLGSVGGAAGANMPAGWNMQDASAATRAANASQLQGAYNQSAGLYSLPGLNDFQLMTGGY
jgi:hypothetical protein